MRWRNAVFEKKRAKYRRYFIENTADSFNKVLRITCTTNTHNKHLIVIIIIVVFLERKRMHGSLCFL